MNITLTKTRHYELQPYGKFVIKWKTRQQHIPNIIPFDELNILQDTRMPLSKEQDVEIVKFMKKYKTDILTDGQGFYTRCGDDLVQVGHQKLNEYKRNPAFQQSVDLGHSWGKIVLSNA